MYLCTTHSACGGQKRTTSALEMESQTAVSGLVWVLGAGLRPFGVHMTVSHVTAPTFPPTQIHINTHIQVRLYRLRKLYLYAWEHTLSIYQHFQEKIS